ncbi:hypothetical protein STEG23_007893 [Scotinomys teguina]
MTPKGELGSGPLQQMTPGGHILPSILAPVPWAASRNSGFKMSLTRTPRVCRELTFLYQTEKVTQSSLGIMDPHPSAERSKSEPGGRSPENVEHRISELNSQHPGPSLLPPGGSTALGYLPRVLMLLTLYSWD